ncbi:MAG: hypothetical protein ACOH18_03075 [Candidatus Saccharimonadaceae bacterium]
MATVNLFGDLALDSTAQASADKLTALTATRNIVSPSDQSGIVAQAVRHDADASGISDGNISPLLVDDEGRLKTSNKSGVYAVTTLGITTSGVSIVSDVSRASNVVFHVKNTGSATMSAGAFSFEGSIDSSDGTNGTWFGIQAIRSNVNTIETATGTLSLTVNAGMTYSWEASVNAYTYMRIRCTTSTTNLSTAFWTIQRGAYATEPIPGIQSHAVTGTVTTSLTSTTVNPIVPATPYFVNSLATTNGILILTGTSGLQAFYATNEGATVAYVKLYNKAAAPTVGTDIPEMTIPIPAAVSGVPGVYVLPIGFNGFRFALGLGIAITGAAVYTDTTAVSAGQVKVKLSRTI